MKKHNYAEDLEKEYAADGTKLKEYKVKIEGEIKTMATDGKTAMLKVESLLRTWEMDREIGVVEAEEVISEKILNNLIAERNLEELKPLKEETAYTPDKKVIWHKDSKGIYYTPDGKMYTTKKTTFNEEKNKH